MRTSSIFIIYYGIALIALLVSTAVLGPDIGLIVFVGALCTIILIEVLDMNYDKRNKICKK